MFYLIAGIPLAAVCAAIQLWLCKKAKSKILKLLPLLISIGCFLAAAIIRGENLFADAVYGISGMGIFAVIAVLWIFGIAFLLGGAAGWLIYLIKRK